uniref:Male-specific Is5 protein n=1 Tax=Rhipicephalus zambeziensis TaxID=60191 RepID=A0A224YCR8_9ACAR
MRSLQCSTLILLLALFCKVNATFLLPFFTDPASVPNKGVDEGFDPVEKEDSTDPPGVGVRGGVEILRLQRTLIHKIEVEITTGRELQRNLTSMRELLVVELQKTSSSTERIEIEQRISRIDILLTQVRTRTDETELRFREFLQRVSTGQIRTETESQTLLQAIWSGYHKSLRNLVRHCAGYLTSIVRGVTGVLANVGMGILDFYRLKFQPIELAIDALTGKGSFHKPINGIIGRR